MISGILSKLIYFYETISNFKWIVCIINPFIYKWSDLHGELDLFVLHPQPLTYFVVKCSCTQY